MEKADIALAVTAGAIFAFDVFNDKTISERVGEYRENPYGRAAVLGSAALLAAHLNGLPYKYDPLQRLFKTIKGEQNGE